VFVVLRSLPYREVLERYEGPARWRLGVLEARYTRATGQLIPLAAEIEQTRADWERAALAVREAAFREIASLIEPEQEAVERLIVRLGGRSVRRYTAINAIAAEVPAHVIDTLAADPAVIEIGLI
jgi:acyl-CoA reductase-like NAD-dependent aldehyde dehydrogenase